MTDYSIISLSLVVAAAENNVIGRDGELPWRLRSDLRNFRKLTLGRPLIMGRKTFQSIGKPLDQRHSIVLTNDRNFKYNNDLSNVDIVYSMHDAVQCAMQVAARSNVNQIFVIGGAGVFAEALPFCNTIHLSRVHAKVDGDVVWTMPSLDEWHETSALKRDAQQGDDYAVTDIVLERVTPVKIDMLDRATI